MSLPRPLHFVMCLMALLAAMLPAGCSGGGATSGGGSPPPPPPTPGFTLSVTPATVTLAQGGTQTIQIGVTAQGGFSGTVAVTAGTLPDGVSLSSSTANIVAGSPATVQVSASGSAPIAQQAIQFSGTSGSLSGSASLQVSVSGHSIPNPFHSLGGAPDRGFWDESRQLLFVTNPWLNELDAISGTDDSVKARISVPQPEGIDQMADGNTLVIGTDAQEIVTVDENTFAVTSHPYSAIGDTIYTLFFPDVAAMANGKVLVNGIEQGVTDASEPLFEWDSTTDTWTQIYPSPSSTAFASFATPHVARSRDGKWAVFADYAAGSDQFFLYDSDTDSFTTVPLETVNPPDNTFGVRQYALNSDGSEIAVASATEVSFFDRSFKLLGTAQLPSSLQNGDGARFSPDGSKLYLKYSIPLVLEEVDVPSFTAVGYLSAAVDDPVNALDGHLIAVDAEQHAYFSVGGGIRVVDLSQTPHPNTSNSAFPVPYCALNGIVPLNTQTDLSPSLPVTGASVYVNGQPATITNGGADVTVPASANAGPADVECTDDTYGNVAVMAQDLSYGVDPVGLSANLLPPTGNTGAYLFGFGFSTSSLGTPTSVTVGGSSSPKILDVQDPGMGVLEGAWVQIPGGTPGATADIAVSSSLGSGTLPSAATYYPAPTILPASGIVQLTFDNQRNRLYALKATEVDVLDASTLQWLTPLTFPVSYSGTAESMGLTPDGSKLVVLSLAGTQPSVMVFDLNGGATSVTPHSGYVNNIYGSMAISNLNQVIIPGLPGLAFDLSTLTYTTLPVSAGQAIRASADGSHIYSADLNNSDGTVYAIDPATFTETSERFGYLFWTDLGVSPDGSHFAAVNAPPGESGDAVGFFNSSLQYVNANAYPDYSPPDDSGVLGATFSPGGQVLVVALGDSIEFWDANTGTLRGRLMTPEELQVLAYPENGVAPEIALNAAGDTIFARSKSGISVIPLPGPLDQIPSMVWPDARFGGPVTAIPTLRGTMEKRMRAFVAGGNRPGQSADRQAARRWPSRWARWRR